MSDYGKCSVPSCSRGAAWRASAACGETSVIGRLLCDRCACTDCTQLPVIDQRDATIAALEAENARLREALLSLLGWVVEPIVCADCDPVKRDHESDCGVRKSIEKAERARALPSSRDRKAGE